MRSRMLVAFALLGACSSFEPAAENQEPTRDAGSDAVAPADAGAVDGASVSDAGDASTPSSAYAAVVLADQPEAYWRCAESAGTASLASSAKTHHLVPAANKPTLGLTGLFSGAGGAVGLDALMGQRLASSTIPFRLPAALAFEAWIYLTSPHDPVVRGIVVHSDGASSYYVYLYNGIIYFETFHEGVQRYASIAISLGEWHHLVAQVAAPDATSVVLDTFVGAGTQLGTGNVVSARSFNIGAADDGLLPLGPGAKLAEIAFYDHVLSPERITAHYLAGKAP